MTRHVRGPTSVPAPHVEDIEWQMQGLCRDPHFPKDLWFPATERLAAKAKVVCLQCPVVVQCRDWALTHREQAGVWGATSEADREAVWGGRGLRHRNRRIRIAEELGLSRKPR